MFFVNVSLAAITNSTVDVETLERSLFDRIGREKCNVVETVEDMIQNAILAATDNIITLRFELAVRSMNAASGWNATMVTANVER